MGVPTFYKWLSVKYKKALLPVIEETDKFVNNTYVPINLNEDNPNKIEFDNFYIDLNGLVHPCSYQEHNITPNSTEEQMQVICDYLNRVISIIRPRNLVFLALDGVAPRAKMNQQRCRRFVSAMETQSNEEVYNIVAAEFKEKNLEVPYEYVCPWDRNAITPGTEFMQELAKVIRYYIAYNIANNSFWKNLKVIFSDSNCPGEGEHKILDYIRTSKHLTNPNITHVIHGKDADLIILSLASHSGNIYVLRESSIKYGKEMDDEEIDNVNNLMNNPEKIKVDVKYRSWYEKFEIISIPILKQYFYYELDWTKLCSRPYLIERVIDDIVLMSILIGNDFLPHMPSLSILTSSFDLMFILYKYKASEIGDYLVNRGKINFRSFQIFLYYLMRAEPQLLHNMSKDSIHQQQNSLNNNSVQDKEINTTSFSNKQIKTTAVTNPNSSLYQTQAQNYHIYKEQQNEKRLLLEISDHTANKHTSNESNIYNARTKNSKAELELMFNARLKEIKQNKITDAVTNTKIIIYEGNMHDYAVAYYANNFGIDSKNSKELNEIIQCVCYNYLVGIEWILEYYIKTINDWQWYYPFYYAPFLVDLYQFIASKKYTPTQFIKNSPLLPFEQLLAVLAPYSKNLLPENYHFLMTHPSSPLIDFYPKTVERDTNGHKRSWAWITKMPFVDTRRLIKHARHLANDLSENVKSRNSIGVAYIYNHNHKRNEIISSTYAGYILEFDSKYKLPEWDSNNWSSLKYNGFPKFQADIPIGTYAICSFDLHYKLLSQLPKNYKHGKNVLNSQDISSLFKVTKGKGYFGINAAKRAIFSVIGGQHYQKFLQDSALANKRND